MPKRASHRAVSYICIGALSLVVAACDAYQPPPLPAGPSSPSTTVPTSILLTASSTFKQQLEIDAMVLSAAGTGIPNVVVTFSVDDGSIAPLTATTDSSGNALSTAVTITGTTVRATIAGGINASVKVLPSVQ